MRAFLDGAWPVLEPGTPLVPGWHLDAVCEYLEAVTLGQIRRLVINIPPRSLKSTCVSICWPAWSWIAAPESRWLFASYSQSLSEDHSMKRRLLLQSAWYQAAWGDRFTLAADQNQKREFKNDQQGTMIATSIDGTVLGKGANVIVVDDPHDPRSAESDADRTTAIRNFDLTFPSRLNDPITGAVVIVMQRLHMADMTAHCLDLGYTHLSLPMRAEDRQRVVFPLSGRVVDRAPGELLAPARWPEPVVADLEKALGPYGASGQLQQRPAPAEGGKLKRRWWRFWYPADGPVPPVERTQAGDGTWSDAVQEPLPAAFDTVQQSWDLTFKDKLSSDYVAGQVQALAGANIYILDEVYEHLDIVGTIDAIRRTTEAWPDALAKYIEDKANGPAVIAMLHREIPGLIGVDPEGGKAARVNAVAPAVAAGNVYLPHPAYAPWVRRFINNCAAFPNAAHDDDVDAFTQGVTRLLAGGAWLGIA